MSLFLTYIYPIQESDFSKKTVARIKLAKLWSVNLHLHEPKNRVYSSFVFYISLRLSWIFVIFKHLSLSSNEKDIIFPWSLEGFLTKKSCPMNLFWTRFLKSKTKSELTTTCYMTKYDQILNQTLSQYQQVERNCKNIPCTFLDWSFPDFPSFFNFPVFFPDFPGFF